MFKQQHRIANNNINNICEQNYQKCNLAKSWNGNSGLAASSLPRTTSLTNTSKASNLNGAAIKPIFYNSFNNLFISYNKYAQFNMSEHFLNLLGLQKTTEQQQKNNLINDFKDVTSLPTSASDSTNSSYSSAIDCNTHDHCKNAFESVGDHVNDDEDYDDDDVDDDDDVEPIRRFEEIKETCPNIESNEILMSDEFSTEELIFKDEPIVNEFKEISNMPIKIVVTESSLANSYDAKNSLYSDIIPSVKVKSSFLSSFNENSKDSSGMGSSITDNSELDNNNTISSCTSFYLSDEVSSRYSGESKCLDGESEDFSSLSESDDSSSNTTLSNLSSNNLLTISEVSTLEENEASAIASCGDHSLDIECILPATPVLLSTLDRDDDDVVFDRFFMPKKSCLARKSKLFINTSQCGSGGGGDDTLMEENASLSINATSSPLITPVSPSLSPMSEKLLSSSLSSTSSASKRRVSFADANGKELFVVRTMSEPSNCPPKLTSKIVHYFLNREFSPTNSTTSLHNSHSFNVSNNTNSDNNNSRFNFNTSSSLNDLSSFGRQCNYDYGISASNYTTDISKMSGSIAIYSLNFNQPASDYVKFREKIENKFVSLENVLLNRFQLNGTIKVKNLSFHKNVFVRCSFNKWKTYYDYPAQFVPSDNYTVSSTFSSPTSHSSASAVFYGHSSPINSNANYYHTKANLHKEFDTFRFEFQLPKTVDVDVMNRAIRNANGGSINQKELVGSIQFCICYKSGSADNTVEYWDNNVSDNYEVLQYYLDIENLKPSSMSPTYSSLNSSSSKNTNSNKDRSSSKTFPPTSAQEFSGVYY
jgi:hypothetical protein